MSYSMQLLLPVNISLPIRGKDDAIRRKKNRQIKGRPRRVDEDSEIVKCSVKKKKFDQLEIIRLKYGLTMPGVIRLAVSRYVDLYGNGEGLPEVEVQEKREPATERCVYVKVPLPPAHVRAIETLAVKKRLINRQSVVDKAMTEFIEAHQQ